MRTVIGHTRHGLPIYLIGGGADDPKDDPKDTPKDDPKDDPKDEPRTFTQAELDRIARREKDAAKRAESERIAKELGVSVDEAKELIAKAKSAADAEKSDAQKAREAADAEKALAETARREAAAERHALRIERALVKAGAPAEKTDRLARLVTAEIGCDDDALTEAIEAVQEDFPELFGTSDSTDEKPKPLNGDPKGAKPPKPKTGDAMSKGAERAKQRINTLAGAYSFETRSNA